ncbi:hypothetical protein VNO78_29143 [Psophocarpus tetragonolobus]|uniref:Pentatricopeptide repeat-containing protein n=1 Tax=Psophocarpus tetragonolobus TaxID=3891 RepID=A0AAN9RUC1_PSOTE
MDPLQSLNFNKKIRVDQGWVSLNPNPSVFSNSIPWLWFSNSKLLRWRPTLHPNPLSAEALSTPIPPPPHKKNQNLEITVCKMMANRAWTTRLQNSIRSLVPHGAGSSPEHALCFYRWVEHGAHPQDDPNYGVLIESFCKANVYDKAEKLLEKVIEKEIVLRSQNAFEMEPRVYNLMIGYLCDNGWTGKEETFFCLLMKKGAQDSDAFSNLICGHSKKGNPYSAFEITKIMGRRGVARDADSYKLHIVKVGIYRNHRCIGRLWRVCLMVEGSKLQAE